MRLLLTEAIELVFGHSAFNERTSVRPGRRVTLIENLVATTRVVLTSEEVVETDFIE
ncbi:unannotated protein [freshwater metagenome]|uniref:Unannotated protein n=1 Tax=freshwater metagenome TaxID=449393 RepID=A0A6J6DLJ6_9ZZZZ